MSFLSVKRRLDLVILSATRYTPRMPETGEASGRNALIWEGASIAELAEGLSTPFFLVSERALRRNLDIIRDALAVAGVPVVVRYCAKTNHELGVLRVLEGTGSQVLVSHLAELELAERAGLPAHRIAFQQPVFHHQELPQVVGRSALVHLYRESDLEQLEAAARSSGSRVPVSIRLQNPAPLPTPLAILSERLGIPGGEVARVARRIARSDRLSLAGVNFYIGTQRQRPAAFAPLLRATGGILRTLERDGISVPEVNLGGGIPSSSLRRPGAAGLLGRWRDVAVWAPPESALGEFCDELARLFGEHVLAPLRGKPPALAVEPGRGIVGNAALLVTRVMAVQGRWLFLDCSRNVLGESPLLFHRRIVAVEPSGRAERHWHLSGNTLNTLDLVDFHRRLPTPAAGDLLAFFDAGAYSISRATRYAGLSPAVHLLASDGSLSCIRRAETGADLAGPMLPAPSGD
jgi:diaminopimelate decarboxylase